MPAKKPPRRDKATRVTAVLSFKGGVGKTTTAAHLAACFAQYGETIAVDGDDRVRSLTTWASAGRLPFEVMSLMEAMRRAPEYLVIDVRGGLPDVELADLARACDLIVVPANPETLSLDGLRKTMDMIEDLRAEGHATAEVRALLTMTRPGKRLIETRRVLHALRVPVMESSIRQSEAFKDATADGVTVREVRGNPLARECWMDYFRATDEARAIIGDVQ